MFSCEHCGIFKNSFFIEQPRWLPLTNEKYTNEKYVNKKIQMKSIRMTKYTNGENANDKVYK